MEPACIERLLRLHASSRGGYPRGGCRACAADALADAPRQLALLGVRQLRHVHADPAALSSRMGLSLPRRLERMAQWDE